MEDVDPFSKTVVDVDPFSETVVDDDGSGGAVVSGVGSVAEGTVTVNRPFGSTVAGNGVRSATCTVNESGVLDTVAVMMNVHVHGGS